MSILSKLGELLARRSAATDEKVVNEVVASLPFFRAQRPIMPEIDVRLMVDEGFRRNVVIHVCISEIAASVSEPELNARFISSGEDLPKDHPLLNLMKRPSSDHTTYSFLESSVIQLQSCGESYIHKGRNGIGEVIQLQPLRADRIQVIPDENGNVSGYNYRLEGMQAQRIPAADMINIKLYDPLNDYYGLSPIFVCAKFGDIDNEAALFLRDFWVNGAVPQGILTLKTKANADQRERIRQQWYENYGRGSSGITMTYDRTTITRDKSSWWRLGVLDADAEYKELGPPADKLRMDPVWGISESRICAAFKVPPILVQLKIGLQSSTYSNYETAIRAFWQQTLLPMYGRYADYLTTQLAAEFDENIEFYFDTRHISALQESVDAKVTRAVALYEAGLATRNEGREIVDLPEMDEDNIIIPQYAGSVDETFEPTEDQPVPALPAPGPKLLTPGVPTDKPPSAPGKVDAGDQTIQGAGAESQRGREHRESFRRSGRRGREVHRLVSTPENAFRLLGGGRKGS